MVALALTNRSLDMVAPGPRSSLKRKLSSDESEDNTASQLKRRRVAFDPDIEIRILSEGDLKSLELVKEEVRRAMKKHAAGEKAAYDGLRALFRDAPTSRGAPSSSLLQKYLVALIDYTPQLDYECKGLVHAVLDCSWIARNDSFLRSYRSFLASLLSIQSGYLSTVLQMLIDMFLHPPSINNRQKDDPPTTKADLQARVHDTLAVILHRTSMASSHLGPVISNAFPSSSDSTVTHVRYIKNIYKVSEYAPIIKGEIQALVMDKLCKIDAQIQTDLEGIDADDDLDDRLNGEDIDNEEHGDLDDEEIEDDISDDGSVSSEESLDPEEQRLKQVKDMRSKLDSVMRVQFAYYDSLFEKGSVIENTRTYDRLLAQFQSIVLPNGYSRHIQFLLFRFSQTSTDFMNRFVDACLQLALASNVNPTFSKIACDYLASYMARGAHVPGSVVRRVFDSLCSHLEQLRILHEPKCVGPDLRRYRTYYAIVQALLYAFCFRWRDLIVTPDGTTPTDDNIKYHEGDFHWHRSTRDIIRLNIFCRLNPLRICAPAIVHQFGEVAKYLRFTYVDSLIETNKRVRLSHSLASGYLNGIGGRETALTGKKGEDALVLDAFFPFDPYTLPRSQRWVNHDYREWTAVPGMPVAKDEDDESNDDEEEEEEEEEDDDDDNDNDSLSE